MLPRQNHLNDCGERVMRMPFAEMEIKAHKLLKQVEKRGVSDQRGIRCGMEERAGGWLRFLGFWASTAVTYAHLPCLRLPLTSLWYEERGVSGGNTSLVPGLTICRDGGWGRPGCWLLGWVQGTSSLEQCSECNAVRRKYRKQGC